MEIKAETEARETVLKGPPASAEVREAWWFGLDRKWWVLGAVGVGTFMSALDGSVVNTIVPVIMRYFAIDLATVEWVMMVYLLTVSGLLLTFGRLGDTLGHKQVYILGFGIFVVGSAFCGLAPTATVLILMRCLQAIGAAMLFSNAPAILTLAFPARQRGQALGMQGTMTYLGLTVGPTLGGFLTDQIGWRSIFFINIPIGIVASLLAYTAIRHMRPPAHGERFDPLGAVTFLAGLTMLLLALSHGQNWGWLSGPVVGLIATSIVLLGIFVVVERRIDQPMLDLSLFRNRIFSTATLSALLNFVCVYAVTFLMPFYLIQYRGFSPGHAGLLLSTQALIMAIVAPLSGSLSDRTGAKLPSSLGMVILTLGLVSLGTLGATASSAEITVRLMTIGLGAGIFVSPNSSALMGAAPKQRQGVASAVLAAARNVGMVLGIAFAGAVFAVTLASHGGSIGPSAGFLPSFRDTYFIVAAFGAAGTLTSLARGKQVQTQPAGGSPKPRQ